MKRPEMPIRRAIRDAILLGNIREQVYVTHLLTEACRLNIEVDVEKVSVKELEKKVKQGKVESIENYE